MPEGLEETLQAFDELVEAHATEPAADPEGSGNFRCEHCVACHNCRFCTECENCRECTYCYGCRDSLGLTQCRHCDASEKLSHSDLCAECVGGSYLTLCVDCEDCVQCFGCVGLSGEEFCVLNEKLPRKEYFARVKELRRELDQRVREGWLPAWFDQDADDGEEPEAPGLGHAAPAEAASADDPVERASTGEWRAAEERRPDALSEPADEGRPPFPELPRDPDDSGVFTTPLPEELPAPPEEIPPPPPYVIGVGASRPDGDDSTRISVSAEELPTLTRSTRPQRSKPGESGEAPGPAAGASVRRGRRPSRS